MNVLDLVFAFGLHPQKVSDGKGGEFASPCPFCCGKDLFKIWPEQNSGSGSFWCRKCETHGVRIQFVIDTQKLGFKAACRVTGDDAIAAEFEHDSDAPYSPRVPEEPVHCPFVPKVKSSPLSVSSHNLWMEKAWNLVSWASKVLPGSERERVLKEKGIGMNSAKVFGLGWIPQEIYTGPENSGAFRPSSKKILANPSCFVFSKD